MAESVCHNRLMYTIPERDHDDILCAFNKAHDFDDKISLFNLIIANFYKFNRRSFAWREIISPYRVVISEIMLQQTQTDRVQQKFDDFIACFPDFTSLAQASFTDVLRLWKGLGYNRRAQAVHKIAQLVVNAYDNMLPSDPVLLEAFPGIGKASARSITAFAFNAPTIFIETNIRTVFIYFFFRDKTAIKDRDIEVVIEKALDKNNAREWYYALMDYGVYLKKTVGNLSRQSSHYSRQSKFIGSDRQIRGQILQALLEQPRIEQAMLGHIVNSDEQRVLRIANDLCHEGAITLCEGAFMLSS